MSAVASPVRDPAWQVSRGAIGLWVTEGVIGVLVLAVGTAAFLLLIPASLGGPVPFLRWAFPFGVLVDAVVAIGIRPRLRYRVHRWEVTDEAVYTLTGWLSRTWTLVPISRIQTVDVTRGVMQQLFGLASVAVLIRELFDARVPAAGALHEAADRWPYPSDALVEAVRRGYAALTRDEAG